MDIGIYIHWPWCQSKCYYCDFNSYLCSDEKTEEEYVNALIKELELEIKALCDSSICVKSMYFGGGTPSLMRAGYIARLFSAISELGDISEDCEKTIECNPCSINEKKIKQLKETGINRISIGVQSFDNSRLEFLGRRHSASQAVDAINLAKRYFDNVSIDLIYGTPNQQISNWEEELQKAVSFGVDHISAYQLSIEDGTKLKNMQNLHIFQEKPEESQREFFDFTRSFLAKYGFENYETSNFAKNAMVCKHNVNIWEYNPYLGLGAGAHSRLFDGVKYVAKSNVKSPIEYISSIKNDEQFCEKEALSIESTVIEMILLGLRLKKGLSLKDLNEKTSKTNTKFEDFVNIDKMNSLIESGMLKLEEDHLKLTEKSYHLLDEVIDEILK